MNKQYIISSKISEDDFREIKEAFEDPMQYLSTEHKIVVGLLPFKSKKFVPNNIKPNDPPQSFQTLNCNSSRDNTITITHHRPLTSKLKSKEAPALSSKPKESKSLAIHYEIENEERLLRRYTKLKESEVKSNIKGFDKLISSNANEVIKHNYIDQEKLLKKKISSRVQSAKISKKISKSVNKKEKDLLMNRIEEHRIKTQMLALIHNDKPISEKYGNNYWMFSLRRPKYLDEVRINYVNVGSAEREIWKQFLEFPYRPVEVIQNSENKTVNKFSKWVDSTYYRNEMKELNVFLPNMAGINELKVEGKKLVEEEFKFLKDYNRLSKNELKMFLYKDPYERKEKYIHSELYKESYPVLKVNTCHCKLKTNKK